MTTPAPAPGWYLDPAGSGRQRYFDGIDWTENYSPAGRWPPEVRSSGSGRTLAIVFGVLGGVVVLFLVLIVAVGVLSGGDKKTDNPINNILDRSASLNEAISDGKFTFTVTGVSEMDTIGMSTPRGRFVVVDVSVKNTSNQEKSFQVNDQMLIGSNGAKYRADWVAASSINNENTLLLQLGPGFTANYRLPFDVPSDVTPDKVELHDSSISGGATVKLS